MAFHSGIARSDRDQRMLCMAFRSCTLLCAGGMGGRLFVHEPCVFAVEPRQCQVGPWSLHPRHPREQFPCCPPFWLNALGNETLLEQCPELIRGLGLARCSELARARSSRSELRDLANLPRCCVRRV